MSHKINKENITAYLNYISKKEGRALPKPYDDAKHYTQKGSEELQKELLSLYQVLQIPKQRGWAIEDRFIRQYVSVADILPDTTPLPSQTKFTYREVNQAIRVDNYKAYVHWLGEHISQPLEDFIVEWTRFDDTGVRSAILKMYADIGISADEAKSAEHTFVQIYNQKPILKQKTQAHQDTTTRKKEPQNEISESTSLQSETTPNSGTPTREKKIAPSNLQNKKLYKESHKRSNTLLFVVCIFLLGIAGWLYLSYSAFNRLPYIYPLTDHIIVRTSATDDGVNVDRMDMFGEHSDGRGGVMPSTQQYRLADKTLYNGFHKVLKESSFFKYLFGGTSNKLYVYARYVTTDLEEYKRMQATFEPLRGCFNELDKLSFSARRAIAHSLLPETGSTPTLFLARPCDSQSAISKNAPLAIFKYIKKANNEMVIIFQATDSVCYRLICDAEGNTKMKSQAVLVTGEGQLHTGGAFIYLGNGICKYKMCSDKAIFIAHHPFTEFTRSKK